MSRNSLKMRYHRISQRPATQRVELFVTPSGLGGTFTVSIVKKLDDGRVLVRVHDHEYAGRLFKPKFEALRATGKFITIPLVEVTP